MLLLTEIKKVITATSKFFRIKDTIGNLRENEFINIWFSCASENVPLSSIVA
jgi:hypothetical protein